MANPVQHAARLRRVLDLDGVTDPAQPQRPQRLALGVVRAVLALDLGDLGHQAAPSGAAASSAAAPPPGAGPWSGAAASASAWASIGSSAAGASSTASCS